MSNSRRNLQLPEPWQKALMNAGITDPITGEPSLRALSRATNLHVITIRNLIFGKTRRPNVNSIADIAKVLNVKPEVVASWVNMAHMDPIEKWEPPAESMLLTSTERNAIEKLIYTLTSGRTEIKNKTFHSW